VGQNFVPGIVWCLGHYQFSPAKEKFNRAQDFLSIYYCTDLGPDLSTLIAGKGELCIQQNFAGIEYVCLFPGYAFFDHSDTNGPVEKKCCYWDLPVILNKCTVQL
jgi:hypothetical protein